MQIVKIRLPEHFTETIGLLQVVQSVVPRFLIVTNLSSAFLAPPAWHPTRCAHIRVVGCSAMGALTSLSTSHAAQHTPCASHVPSPSIHRHAPVHLTHLRQVVCDSTSLTLRSGRGELRCMNICFIRGGNVLQSVSQLPACRVALGKATHWALLAHLGAFCSFATARRHFPTAAGPNPRRAAAKTAFLKAPMAHSTPRDGCFSRHFPLHRHSGFRASASFLPFSLQP